MVDRQQQVPLTPCTLPSLLQLRELALYVKSALCAPFCTCLRVWTAPCFWRVCVMLAVSGQGQGDQSQGRRQRKGRLCMLAP